jgi:hypothetical protein
MKSFHSFLKILSVVLLISGIGFSAYGQNYPGNDHKIYQICVGTIGVGESLAPFDNLRDFGFISMYSLAYPPTEQSEVTGSNRRVFLGPYLGEESANKVLGMVQTRGYTDAYIEADENTLQSKKGRNLIYSVQIGAFANPNMRKFSSITNMFAHGIFLTYEGGLFKVLSGMYDSDNADYVRSEVVPYLKSRGYNGFLRAFRQPYGG